MTRTPTPTTLTAALAAALIATAGISAPAMAQGQGHGQGQSHKAKKGPGNNLGQQVSRSAHRFKKGEKFDRSRASNYAEIDYRKYRGLKAPPPGHRYVRSGSDILLITVATGLVASVLTGIL